MHDLPSHLTNTIVLGDCIDALGEMPDESVDLIVSSPPYNVGKEYETRRALQEYVLGQAELRCRLARRCPAGGQLQGRPGPPRVVVR